MTTPDIALARRFWMHVHDGGTLTSLDVGRMVTALEDLDTAFSNLHREYERRGDTIAELETENTQLKQMWWDAGDVTDLAGTIAELEAKLAQQDDLVQAAVTAALREAAQAARLSISEREEWPPKDGDVLVDDCMAAIFALIPKGEE